MLTLSEELFLLTLNEKRNSVGASTAHALPAALIGAMFAELVFIQKIRVADNENVILIDNTPVEDHILNQVLKKIGSKKKPKKLNYWFETFRPRSKKLQKEHVASLIAKSVLKEKNKRLLWVIPYIDYSQAEASAKFWRKRQLRAIVLAGVKIDPQSVALLSLVKACGLLDYIFTTPEIKFAAKWVDKLIKDESLSPDFLALMDKISTAAQTFVGFTRRE